VPVQLRKDKRLDAQRVRDPPSEPLRMLCREPTQDRDCLGRRLESGDRAVQFVVERRERRQCVREPVFVGLRADRHQPPVRRHRLNPSRDGLVVTVEPAQCRSE
jgi:hypothetical protein